MRIERIAAKPDGVGRYRLEFEGGEILRLYRQTMEEHRLYVGQELTSEEYTQLCAAACAMSAKMRAVRIVAATNVSKQDLQHRLLQKGEDPEQAKQAVEWLAELSLVDDAETARQTVERCIAKGYGLARAKQALYEKKIPKELWDEVLADYPEQTDAITAYLRSHWDADMDERAKNRLVNALLRRGHAYEQIRKAFDIVRQEQNEEDSEGSLWQI